MVKLKFLILSDFADCFTLLSIQLGPKIGELVRKISMNNNSSENDSENEDQEESFICANCDKNFMSKRKLNRHVREVHNKTVPRKDKKSYSCENCGKVHEVDTSI